MSKKYDKKIKKYSNKKDKIIFNILKTISQNKNVKINTYFEHDWSVYYSFYYENKNRIWNVQLRNDSPFANIKIYVKESEWLELVSRDVRSEDIHLEDYEYIRDKNEIKLSDLIVNLWKKLEKKYGRSLERKLAYLEEFGSLLNKG